MTARISNKLRASVIERSKICSLNSSCSAPFTVCTLLLPPSAPFLLRLDCATVRDPLPATTIRPANYQHRRGDDSVIDPSTGRLGAKGRAPRLAARRLKHSTTLRRALREDVCRTCAAAVEAAALHRVATRGNVSLKVSEWSHEDEQSTTEARRKPARPRTRGSNKQFCPCVHARRKRSRHQTMGERNSAGALKSRTGERLDCVYRG